MTAVLVTWQQTLVAAELDDLVGAARAPQTMCYGQRPAGFELAPMLSGPASGWRTGRCFNPQMEIRWWPGENSTSFGVLVLECLPNDWKPPAHWRQERRDPLIERPVQRFFLCVGRYGPNQDHQAVNAGAPGEKPAWWEHRYVPEFHYLDTAPPDLSKKHSDRVFLRAFEYKLHDGRLQHRLLEFVHAGAITERSGRNESI